MGFENELIGQTIFPRQPSLRSPSRVANFPDQQVLPDVLKTVPDLPPPRRNMPSTAPIRQGGKLGIRKALGPVPNPPIVVLRNDPSTPVCRLPFRGAGKPALTVFYCDRVFS